MKLIINWWNESKYVLACSSSVVNVYPCFVKGSFKIFCYTLSIAVDRDKRMTGRKKNHFFYNLVCCSYSHQQGFASNTYWIITQNAPSDILNLFMILKILLIRISWCYNPFRHDLHSAPTHSLPRTHTPPPLAPLFL